MDIKLLHNLKSNFVTREVGNELIIVPLSSNVAHMNELFTLNETAKFIWENIDTQSTIEGLITLITDSFDINDETAARDIEAFLANLERMLMK
jgi:hypothetical protein